MTPPTKPPPRTGKPVVLPGSVRAALRTRSPFLPAATKADLIRVLAGLHPRTAPADEALIEAVLLWIGTIDPTGQPLIDWADYAYETSRRLHDADHPQARRAYLARTTARAGILTDHRSEAARAAVARITDVCGQPDRDESALTAHLTAYAAVHTRGGCDTATSEVARTLHDWASRDHPSTAGLSTAVTVHIAILTACGRGAQARRVLDEHPTVLGRAGSQARDLFAECALEVMDKVAAHHQEVCTSDHQPRERPDWHAWSALLRGDPPRPRTTPGPAAPTAPGALNLSELPGRLDSASLRADEADTAYRAHRWTTDIYLICDSCRLALLLGTTTVHPHAPNTPTAPITFDGKPAWHSDPLSRAIWRLLSEHPGHELRVITRRSHHHRKYEITPTAVIGGPRQPAGIRVHTTLDTYAAGWPTNPDPPDCPGATPRTPHGENTEDTGLICVSCSLKLHLGTYTTPPDTPQPIITIAGRPAHHLPTATTAAFRFLTDHAGHDLILLADSEAWEGFSWRTGNHLYTITAVPTHPRDFGDITHDQYVDHWPEHPTRPRYRGFDPVPQPTLPAPDAAGLQQICRHRGMVPGTILL